MKKETTYAKQYMPFYDDTPDPEDLSPGLYPSQQDLIERLLNDNYINMNKKYLLVRDNSLTIVSVNRTSIIDRNKPYQVTINVTTEAESDPQHPKELTDLFAEQGF